MDQHSVPDTEKVRLAAAWASAHYFVSIARRDWLFTIGQDAEDIERELMAERYLFITAWNPPPGLQARQHNLAADERLQLRLREAALEHHPALGCDARGGAVERGWLVLDAPLPWSDALARDFGQGGTLAWRAGHPVRLRMQWPRPPQAPADDFIDWVG
jgi:hypothetical protein